MSTEHSAKPDGDAAATGAALATLAGRVIDSTPEPGRQTTAIDGLELVRVEFPTSCTASVYEPCLAIIVQGRKSLSFGDREIVYGAGCYLASSVHLPVLAQIEQASPERPYLGVKLVIDPQQVADLVLELGDRVPAPNSRPELGCGLGVASLDRGMLDALDRLLRLLDTPADAPILAPLARREIIYRALIGAIGPRMRRFVQMDSQANRISRVIALIKDRYAEPLRIGELADRANMSESSLYHSFKQVTRMSPLQFQKSLRLHEARRLMLAEGLEAGSASYRVGYESPSHFSRDYSRMFGAPPRADVNELRSAWRVPA